jgi:hypothetical protein
MIIPPRDEEVETTQGTAVKSGPRFVVAVEGLERSGSRRNRTEGEAAAPAGHQAEPSSQRDGKTAGGRADRPPQGHEQEADAD